MRNWTRSVYIYIYRSFIRNNKMLKPYHIVTLNCLFDKINILTLSYRCFASKTMRKWNFFFSVAVHGFGALCSFIGPEFRYVVLINIPHSFKSMQWIPVDSNNSKQAKTILFRAKDRGNFCIHLHNSTVNNVILSQLINSIQNVCFIWFGLF